MIILFLATSFAATGYAIATSQSVDLDFASKGPTFGFMSNTFIQQGISGRAKIANLSPVCTVRGVVPASSPSLVISSSDGRILIVPLSCSLADRCALVSQFLVPLQPGRYSVTLSPRGYMGCGNLPVTADVNPGSFAAMNTDIVTGIV